MLRTILEVVSKTLNLVDTALKTRSDAHVLRVHSASSRLFAWSHRCSVFLRPLLIKLGGIICTCLILSACTPTQKILPDTKPDPFETEKLAATAYEKGDFLESEKHYTVLVREVPEEALPWFRLGNIYASTNRPDAAISAYREALIRDPEMTKIWFNMGVLQLKQAANSFEQLGIYGDKDDPLYLRSRDLLDGIIKIIQGNNAKTTAAEHLMQAFEPGEEIELIKEKNAEEVTVE